jgi:leader peptidase (prepilin peptidase)/N-methyltransferase
MEIIFFAVPFLFLFFIGCCVGSFLNVVIYRSERGESWVWGRSHCESCQKTLAWYDNIPIFSYLALRARCRYCKTPLSSGHLIIESLMGMLFVWWYVMGSLFFKLTEQPFSILQPLFWLGVGVILLTIFVTDLQYLYIPDAATLLLTIMVVIYRVALVLTGVMQLQDFVLSICTMAGAMLFIWSLWYFTKGKGMGYGDVKLALPLGLLLGWPSTLVWLFVSFVSGAVFGLVLLVFKKAHMKQALPFGPFLILGTLVALIWGDEIFRLYVTLIL